MAPGGLLHVTIVSANLLGATDGGSDSATEDAYAAVVCGSHQFTTNTVANHATRPSWNESYTFQLEEYNELETQHILVEVFAEKPKLDELLGLAKIPLSKVIASGDETSVHSLNRPDDLYSGHVKVSMKWDSQQMKVLATKSAYPEAFVPCARYDPNASTAKPQVITEPAGHARVRGTSSDVSQHQHEYGMPESPERRAHHRSSSYPSRAYNFSPGYSPSPSASPSTSARGHQPKSSYDGSYAPAAFGNPPRSPGHSHHGQPPSSPGSYHNGVPPLSPGSQGPPSNGYPSEAQQTPSDSVSAGAVQNGAPHSPHGRGSAPHVPYVANHGQQAVNVGGHAPYQKGMPMETDPANVDQKQPDDAGTTKMSKSRRAEMAKLAELSRLTESAKNLSTGFSHPHHGQQTQHVPAPRARNDNNPPQQQQNQGPPRPRNDVLPTQQQQLQGSSKARSDIVPSQQQIQVPSKPRNEMIPSQQEQLQIASKPRNEIVPSQQQQLQVPPNNFIISQQQQFQSTSRPNKHIIPSQQQQLHATTRPRNDVPIAPQAAQVPPRQIQVFQGPSYDGVQQKTQNGVQKPRVQQRPMYGQPQQMLHTSVKDQHGAQGTEVVQQPPNQLQMISHVAEVAKHAQKPEKVDKKAEKAARKAAKEALKAEKEAHKAGKERGEKPERESHVSHIRQTLNMLRKTKIFR